MRGSLSSRPKREKESEREKGRNRIFCFMKNWEKLFRTDAGLYGSHPSRYQLDMSILSRYNDAFSVSVDQIVRHVLRKFASVRDL